MRPNFNIVYGILLFSVLQLMKNFKEKNNLEKLAETHVVNQPFASNEQYSDNASKYFLFL
jgi:hypothetical protein